MWIEIMCAVPLFCVTKIMVAMVKKIVKILFICNKKISLNESSDI